MIEELGLSIRARNGLIKSGYRKISDLILLEFDDLKNIKNLGIGSVNEIQEKLNAYLNKMEKESEEYVQTDRSVSGYQILEVFNGHEFEIFTENRIKENLPDANEDDILYYLDKFVNNGNIIKTSEGYEYYKQSFFEYIQQVKTSKHKNLLDEKTQQIILLRASGMTLEEIGELKDVTRERIRQIESKGLREAFSYANRMFKEDAYQYIFSHYTFENGFYKDFLHLTKETIYYIKMCIRDSTYHFCRTASQQKSKSSARKSGCQPQFQRRVKATAMLNFIKHGMQLLCRHIYPFFRKAFYKSLQSIQLIGIYPGIIKTEGIGISLVPVKTCVDDSCKPDFGSACNTQLLRKGVHGTSYPPGPGTAGKQHQPDSADKRSFDKQAGL